MPLFSVVIPVYNSEGCLKELYKRLKESLEPISNDFELIMIEDCGQDQSWSVIKALAKYDKRVKGFQFSRNFGQHYGITAGLDLCNGDWVVIMDGDLQDRPEEIPKLYSMALQGYDVVLAERSNRKDTIIKKITSLLFYKLFSILSDIKYNGNIGNFRIISRKVVNSFRTIRERLRFFGGIIEWMGFKTVVVEVEHGARFSGNSAYNWKKRWLLAIDAIIAYSDKPLRLLIRIGFLISGFAFAYGAYIIYLALSIGTSISGWSSLIVSVYLLGGIIIGTLGLIGVYLGNTFDEVKRRPLYIISESTQNE
jgi:glycosyltransferase involved in cell wall biosynthesis